MKRILVVFLFGTHLLLGQNTNLETGTSSLSLTGCSILNDTIKITGTGNIQSHKAYLNSETALEEIDMNFKVRIDSLDTLGAFRFGIGKYSTAVGTTIGGTMVELGGTDSTTNVYISKLNGTTATMVMQFPLPFNLQLGINYQIRVGKRVRALVLEIYSDEVFDSFLYDTLTYPTPYVGCLWGTPFIGCKYGTISVNDFSLSTTFDTSPRLSVWGDSFIEGNAAEDVETRYVSLIKDSIGHQNIAIMGRGGESSVSLNSRFTKERKWFGTSKYGLVAIGVNDNTFSVWKSNMQKCIDSLKKDNIIPIIATLSPRADRLAFITQVNNWIRTDYQGAYIDVSKAVSITGTTWIPGMARADNIHPSDTGHLSIYNRITVEAPYLFRDSSDFSIDFMNETTHENVANFLQYSSSSHFDSSSVGDSTPIIVIPGETVYFRDTAIVPDINSLYYILPVPERPDPPTMPVVNSAAGTFDWTYNPLYHVYPYYEFSIDSGATWTTCYEKPINSPGTTSLELRVKAEATHFKSVNLLFEMEPVLTALNSVDPANVISVFPNPFNDKLIVKNITEAITITICSVDGRIIKTADVNSESTEIETQDLSKGFYVMTITNKNLTKSFKLLKN